MKNNTGDNELMEFLNKPFILLLISTVLINGTVLTYNYITSSFATAASAYSTEYNNLKNYSLNLSKLKMETLLRLENMTMDINSSDNESDLKTNLSKYYLKTNNFYIFPEYKDYDLIVISYKIKELLLNTKSAVITEENNKILADLELLQRTLYYIRTYHLQSSKTPFTDVKNNLKDNINSTYKSVIEFKTEFSYWEKLQSSPGQ